MRLGPHELPNNVVVAPMAGVTDRPFRRLCKALGLTVERLIRVRYGPIELGDLAVGRSRPLTRREIDDIAALAGAEHAPVAEEIRSRDSVELPMATGGPILEARRRKRQR